MKIVKIETFNKSIYPVIFNKAFYENSFFLGKGKSFITFLSLLITLSVKKEASTGVLVRCVLCVFFLWS